MQAHPEQPLLLVTTQAQVTLQVPYSHTDRICACASGLCSQAAVAQSARHCPVTACRLPVTPCFAGSGKTELPHCCTGVLLDCVCCVQCSVQCCADVLHDCVCCIPSHHLLLCSLPAWLRVLRAVAAYTAVCCMSVYAACSNSSASAPWLAGLQPFLVRFLPRQYAGISA